MSVAIPQSETRIVLSNVPWETYEALAEVDRGGTRLAYDRGILEIMSPSLEHERVKKLLGRMIETFTLELDIPISSGGSTTLKSQMKEKGVEPDECYYVANEPRIRGRDDFDLTVDPPPDLAIEIDITSSSMDQLGLYAALGVPEVWLCDGTGVRIFELQADGTFAPRPQSPAFPLLAVDVVERFLRDRNQVDETTWIRRFRDWARTIGH